MFGWVCMGRRRGDCLGVVPTFLVGFGRSSTTSLKSSSRYRFILLQRVNLQLSQMFTFAHYSCIDFLHRKAPPISDTFRTAQRVRSGLVVICRDVLDDLQGAQINLRQATSGVNSRGERANGTTRRENCSLSHPSRVKRLVHDFDTYSCRRGLLDQTSRRHLELLNTQRSTAKSSCKHGSIQR